MTLMDLAMILGAYFLGSVPVAYVVVRAKMGVDIRTLGSGNVGATNVGRLLGRKWGVFVFLCDVLKGALPATVALLAHGLRPGSAGLPAAVALTGLAAIVGHNWPIYLGFRGGKGVATSCGVFLAIFPLGLIIALAVWVVVVKLTRYVSVASMVGSAALLVCAIFLREDPFGADKYLTGFAALAAVMGIARHHANIKRLIAGTEGKIGAKKDG